MYHDCGWEMRGHRRRRRRIAVPLRLDRSGDLRRRSPEEGQRHCELRLHDVEIEIGLSKAGKTSTGSARGDRR